MMRCLVMVIALTTTALQAGNVSVTGRVPRSCDLPQIKELHFALHIPASLNLSEEIAPHLCHVSRGRIERCHIPSNESYLGSFYAVHADKHFCGFYLVTGRTANLSKMHPLTDLP